MTIQLTSVLEVKEFVSIATVQPYEILVRDGERCVNAKSFMELCTLDFSHPLQVDAGEHEAELAPAAEKFIAS